MNVGLETRPGTHRIITQARFPIVPTDARVGYAPRRSTDGR
jgi:hypothetical protein